jgi:hypothetical protein
MRYLKVKKDDAKDIIMKAVELGGSLRDKQMRIKSVSEPYIQGDTAIYEITEMDCVTVECGGK